DSSNAHASQVGGQVVNLVSTVQRCLPILFTFEIQMPVHDVRNTLPPLVKRFAIDGAQIGVALTAQIRDEVPANETAAACNNHEVAFHEGLLLSSSGFCEP